MLFRNLFKSDKFRDFRTGQMDDDVRSRKSDKDKKPSSKALDKFGEEMDAQCERGGKRKRVARDEAGGEEDDDLRLLDALRK